MNILESVEYKDKDLYNTVKRQADKKFTKNSYVKNLWVIREYKRRGGKVKYKGEKPSGTSIKKQIKSNQEVFTVDYTCECYNDDDLGSEELIFCKIEAAEAKKKLNKPFRTPNGPKKFSVYVKNEKGNVVKVNFGDPNMEIKRDDPNRRKNFRARHNCDSPGPKWKARYWSCKFWSGPTVTELLK